MDPPPAAARTGPRRTRDHRKSRRSGQTAQRPDELELWDDHVDRETEPCLAHEVKAGLGLALHVAERIASGKEVHDQNVGAVAGIGEVAKFVRRVEGPPHEAAAGADALFPGKDVAPEDQVHAGLKSIEPALLHQVEAELAEAIPRLVVAECRSKHGARHRRRTMRRYHRTPG